MRGAELTLTVADYRQGLLAVLPEARPQIERDATTLREFLMQLYGEQCIAQEAQRLGLLDQPEVQAGLATARRQVLVNAVIDQFKAHLQLPDFTELARDIYLTHHEEFTQPEQIRVAHTYNGAQCPCEDENGQKRQQAEAVLAELRQGADFGALALKYSEDEATAKQGAKCCPGSNAASGRHRSRKPPLPFPSRVPSARWSKRFTGITSLSCWRTSRRRCCPFEQVQGRIVEKLAGQYRLNTQKEYESRFLPAMDQLDQTTIEALLKAAPASAPPEASAAVKATP